MARKTHSDKNGFKYIIEGGRKVYRNPAPTPKQSIKSEPDKKLQSASITTMEDGTICIGSECVIMKIPPKGKGNITLDLGECPDNIKERIASKVGIEGVSTDFEIKKHEQEKK